MPKGDRDAYRKLATDLRALGYADMARWVELDAQILFGTGDPATQPIGVISGMHFRSSGIVPADEVWLISGDQLVKARL